MKKSYLIVIDMQKDFITGSLASKYGQDIVNNVKKKIEIYQGEILVTKDTHFENYLDTQEGKLLPIKHCIKETNGWRLVPEIEENLKNKKVFEKNTFGSVELIEYLKDILKKYEIEKIELIGVCTDICVISNALLLKANFPEIPLYVDSSCCAGSSLDAHEAALKVLKSCQIIVC